MSLSLLNELKELREFFAETAEDIRLGRRSRIASLLAALCFLGGSFSRGSLPAWASTLLMVAGIAIGLLGARRATPVRPRPNLAALKGASPFGPEDGESFRWLGRERELGELRSWILGEQVAVVLLWGPSGVGKTSLAAGLRRLLPAKQVVYADASQESFESILGDALRQRSAGNAGQEASSSLEQILTEDRRREQVVVVDNAELVRDVPSLFHLVQSQLAQTPPYKRVFIFIVDEGEYVRTWDPGSWTPPSSNALKRIRISRFEEQQAQAVAESLVAQAGISLSPELIQEVVRDAVVRDEDGGVSPLVLSIVLQFIGRAGWGERFDLDEYRASGESLGAMTAFLEERLKHVGKWREALSVIVDHVDSMTRELALDGLPTKPPHLSRVIDVLTAPEVRVLRSVRQPATFRILPEWYPVLQAILAAPTPDIASLEQRVKDKFAVWNVHRYDLVGPFRRLREGKYLLSRKEVRLVERHRERLSILRTPGGLRFVRDSRRYQTTKLVLVVALILSFIPVSVSGYRAIRSLQTRTTEHAWGLPDDFGDYRGQLRALSVRCIVNDLQWVPRKLTWLEAGCQSVRSLAGVPSKIKHLGLGTAGIKDLAGLPESVEVLDISFTEVLSLEGVQGNRLKELDISGIGLLNMKLIPRSVSNLKLQHPDIDNLEGLPEELTDLEIRGTSIASLQVLPDSVRRLTLHLNGSLVIDSLPAHLERLETDRLPAGLSYPPHFTSLSLANLKNVTLPAGITELELAGSSFSGDLPGSLTSLKIHDGFQVALHQLPPKLTHLKMRWPEGASFAALPEHITELDLSPSEKDLKTVGGIPRVTVLNIGRTAVPDFRDVPDSVTMLHFQFCVAAHLDKFPKNLKILDLAGCERLDRIENLPGSLKQLNVAQTPIASLPRLPEGLTNLDISNTEISILPELPSTLEDLTLHIGQVESLEGLPSSVTRLTFVLRDKGDSD